MAFASRRGSKWDELLGLVSLSLTLVIFLSLISYDPSDPSFNVVSYKEGFSNYIGKFGAYLADLLFQIFGIAAFLLPLYVAAVAFQKILSRKVGSPYLKGFGLFLTICSVSTAASLFALRLPFETNFPPGGVIGTVCSAVLLGYFNLPGSIIVVSTIFFGALLLLTNFSFVAAAQAGASLARRTAASIAGWRRARPRPAVPRSARRESIPAPAAVEEKAGESEARRVGESEAAGEKDQEPAKQSPAIAQPTPRIESRHDTAGQPQRAPARAQRAGRFELPPLGFLDEPEGHTAIKEEELVELAGKITVKCGEFGVTGNVIQIHPGPVVTTFEFKPDPGVKYSRILTLIDDICLALRAESIRIDRIAGKSTVGIEVPNQHREIIHLREIIESENFRRSPSKLTLGLGKLINGETYVTDLSRMPHLLIAGATGTGKSVALNAMITSIIYKATPDEVKFILIDPKRLELGIYADIPHLLTPIVTEVKRAANALQWATREMEERYRNLAVHGVRNIDQYNGIMRRVGRGSQYEDERPLPYIVIVIDELADLMILAGREVEAAITRLAQMARAVGIHLIISTQRPSVDVITGLIKANFPCRISFRVSSKVDSRTILDANGAEQLLGNGDMLFLPPGSSRLIRVHGAYVSEKEAEKIIEFLKKQQSPEYNQAVLEYEREEADDEMEGAELEPIDDELYAEAVRVVVEMRRASTSLLQRRLQIGYGRAARLLDIMEKEGVVGPSEGSRPREVLVGLDYLERFEDGEGE